MCAGSNRKGEVFQRYYTTFLLGGLLDSETESRDLKHYRRLFSTEIIDRKQFNSPVVLKRKEQVHSINPLLLIETTLISCFCNIIKKFFNNYPLGNINYTI